jgi:hypothetical protein
MAFISRYTVLTAIVGLISIYWSHKALRMQYFRHCHRNLFRVIMFDRSEICTNVGNVLNLVEVACNQVVKHATTYMLGTMGTLATAMVTAVATRNMRSKVTSTSAASAAAAAAAAAASVRDGLGFHKRSSGSWRSGGGRWF